MKNSAKKPAYRPRQQTSQELLDDLSEFIRNKFYPHHPIPFAKDRPRLLKWVILWPAKWLDNRGVTLPADRYKHLLCGILLDALRFGDFSKINYLPAWLGQTVQSHFRHHGDAIYDEAKSMRTITEQIITNLKVREPDPTHELALAHRLLKKPKQPPRKPPAQPLLDL